MTSQRALHLGIDKIKPNPALAARLPADVARRYHALPLTEADGEITVAMADPDDAEACQAITRMLGASTYLVQADPELIDRLIAEMYLPGGDLHPSMLVWSPDQQVARTLAPFVQNLAEVLTAQWTQSIIPETDQKMIPTLTKQIRKTHADLLLYPIEELKQNERRTITSVQEELLDKLSISQLITTNLHWPIKRLLLIVRNEVCDDPAIQWALKIAGPSAAQITVLPITMRISGVYRLGTNLEPNLVNLLNPSTELGQKLRRISRLLVDNRIETTLKFREEPAYWQIRWEVNEGDYDMLIIGREPRNPYMRGLVGELVKPLLGWIDRPILITKPLPE